jgi:hypothetical protein
MDQRMAAIQAFFEEIAGPAGFELFKTGSSGRKKIVQILAKRSGTRLT